MDSKKIKSNTIVIGLTGGIASGKSTITKALHEKGAHIIDADKLGHLAYTPNTEPYNAVLQAFSDVPDLVKSDGTINRAALGPVVFGDKNRMTQLTDIVWPAIEQKLVELIQTSNARVICIEAAVLVEAGWAQRIVDQIWVVHVPVEVAKTRLMIRNNFSEDEAMMRISSQMSNEERLKHADLAISNAGTPEEAAEFVQQKLQELISSKL